MDGRQIRKCKRHSDSQVTRVCLKETCECQGLLCEKCMSEHHKPMKTCIIDHQTEPLSYFTINQNRAKDMGYFTTTLSSLCDLWEKGNQIMQQQMQRLESTFLFQLNILCRTFAIDSAEELEQGLKFVQQEQDEQLTLMNINTLRCLHKNRECLQNVDGIQVNTVEICAKIAASLETAFCDLTKHFKKLNQILDNSDIFSIRSNEPIKPTDRELLRFQVLRKNQTPKKVLFSLVNKPHENQKKQPDSISINSYNIQRLTEDQAILEAEKMIIEDNPSSELIIEAFLNKPYQLQTLIIESPSLATEDNITILVACLKTLKNLVFDCKNELWRCNQALVQSNNSDLAALERLQYFFDFRRGLENRDILNFFVKKKTNKPPKHNEDWKVSHEWSADRKALPSKATFQLVRRFNLKNMWLAYVNRSEQANFFIGTYDISFLEQLTLGSFSQDHTSICNDLQVKLKTLINLKSLTLIKISFLMFQFSGIFSKMNKLEVLVLHELPMQKDQKNWQIFFNSIPRYCPLLRKLLVSDLQGISIDFISHFSYLETLILTRSQNLTFGSSCVLNIRHLNLYGADWNYGHLLQCNKNEQLTYLNLGCTAKRLDQIYPFIDNLASLSSLCLDKATLGPQFITILNKTKETLENLSIASCPTNINLKIVDSLNALKACSRLQHIDINKCDFEEYIVKNIPATIRYLVISRINEMIRKQLEAIGLIVIETE